MHCTIENMSYCKTRKSPVPHRDRSHNTLCLCGRKKGTVIKQATFNGVLILNHGRTWISLAKKLQHYIESIRPSQKHFDLKLNGTFWK